MVLKAGKVTVNSSISIDPSLTINGNVAGIVNVPSSATSTGVQNQIAYDSNYFYICVAENTWVRSPLSTW